MLEVGVMPVLLEECVGVLETLLQHLEKDQ